MRSCGTSSRPARSQQKFRHRIGAAARSVVATAFIFPKQSGRPYGESAYLSPSRCVCIFCQITEQFEECGRLTDQESRGRPEVDHIYSNSVGLSGADDGACWELAAQEWARLGHDEVGLELFAAKRWRVQVGEGDRDVSHGICRGEGRSVAGLVGTRFESALFRWGPMLMTFRRTSTTVLTSTN